MTGKLIRINETDFLFVVFFAVHGEPSCIFLKRFPSFQPATHCHATELVFQYTHKRTHTRARTHAHTCAHTRAHTHTQSLSLSFSFSLAVLPKRTHTDGTNEQMQCGNVLSFITAVRRGRGNYRELSCYHPPRSQPWLCMCAQKKKKL